MKQKHGSILLHKMASMYLKMINCHSEQYNQPQQHELAFSGKPQTYKYSNKTYMYWWSQ
jgi:hypothetical protein